MYDFPTAPVQNQDQWQYRTPGGQYRPPTRKPKRNSCLYSVLATGGCLLLLGCVVASIVVGGGIWQSFTRTPSIQVQDVQPYDEANGLGSTPKDRVYKVKGKPTISATYINTVLERNGSPAKGKGKALYDYGIQFGVDPAYALAFFWHESHFGTLGVAQKTHSLGNIRSRPNEPEYQGYRLYKTWEEGFEDWYRLIAQTYVAAWGLSTVDKIIPVYAPREDHNDEEAYILTVKLMVDKWRAEMKQQE